MKVKFLFFILLLFLIHACGDNSSNSNTETNSVNPEKPEKYTQEEREEIAAGMKKAMLDFATENSVRDLEDAKLQLRALGIGWYNCYGKLVEAKADSVIWKMKDTAAAILSKYQTKMFPKYRKVFADDTDKKLWIEDCSAFLSGNNNEVLNLVGISFAPNRRKQESYETLLEVLKQYRFKKLTFRTFKSDTDATNYEIKSDADTEYLALTQ